MYFCRCCNQDFDVIKRKPMILLCGHTFCHSCLSDSFATTAKFDCVNCPFTTNDFAALIPNLILTDLNSVRQSAFSAQPTLLKPPFSPQIPDNAVRFFRSPYAACDDVSFAQKAFQQISSSKNIMEIEGKNEESIYDAFKGISLRGDPMVSTAKVVACNSQLCRARASDGKCSGTCRNGSLTKRNPINSSLRNNFPGSAFQSHGTPAKPRPFANPSDPRFHSTFYYNTPLHKAAFGSPGFGNSGSKRCSRAGCLNIKHVGFGDCFMYCSLICHKIVEGRDWNGGRA